MWSVIMIGVCIGFYIVKRPVQILLTESGEFFVLAITVLILNMQLRATLATLFENKSFDSELSYLNRTLTVHGISYFFVMGRAAALVTLIIKQNSMKVWVCNNNDLMNILNIGCYVVIDLLPFSTIFFTHWKNFRAEIQKQRIIEMYARKPTAHNKVLDGPMQQHKFPARKSGRLLSSVGGSTDDLIDELVFVKSGGDITDS